MFIFENLEVYKKSMILSEKVLNTTKNVKNRSINDQLSRAVLSIPLNIAEGQGRIHSRDWKDVVGIDQIGERELGCFCELVISELELRTLSTEHRRYTINYLLSCVL